ncbi:MAG TPA: endonuclease MutS2 [Clostridia bacterium]|nr:endonuclease MutS2 [Clostridia bacterium]
MNPTTLKTLEFDKIKELLKSYTVSSMGSELIDRLEPSLNINTVTAWLNETTEACAVLQRSGNVPIHSLNGMENVMGKLAKSIALLPEDLELVHGLLREVSKLKRFMKDKSEAAPVVSSYALSAYELDELSEEIDRCIRNGAVDDKASSELCKTRKRMVILEDRIKSRLEAILRSPAYARYLQDGIISSRNGHYVVPVKKEYRKNVEGEVLDNSASGSTVFIEPAEVRKLHEELNHCRIDEEREVYRILSELTLLVESGKNEISINLQVMAYYDFLFAKARFSRLLEANPVNVNTDKKLDLRGARHPLIGKSAVPLDFSIGNSYRTLVITGPNTGGKTVALKTVGLLTLMVQSGLHVPAGPESEFSIFTDILVDIGDGQSIEQSLSTFSSHIRNIISIIECADKNTLVIVDELGAGTDPGEGMGLAIAVLEETYKCGAVTIATTHYSEIKHYAGSREGFRNGCMEFDLETLKPLYRLKIGEPGESNAFLIALRLGMRRDIIERAHEITYKEKKEYREYKSGGEAARVINTEAVEKHVEQAVKNLKLSEDKKKTDRLAGVSGLKVGDCVYISSMGRTGIVCEAEDGKGNLGVMVMHKKFIVNKTRLSLYIASNELYPEDYDLDIVMESKDTRKKKKLMGKRHVEDMVIEVKK